MQPWWKKMTLESFQIGLFMYLHIDIQKKHPLIYLKGHWFESLLCFTDLCAFMVTSSFLFFNDSFSLL